MLALILIYKEEDCLAFGDCEDQLYTDMGDGDMAFGRRMTSEPWMECSQSLFIVRHAFIPQMVSAYLGMGKDGDVNNLGERKFQNLEARFGTHRIRRLTFGVDRERPLPFDAPVWFGQQFTNGEMEALKRRNLI